MSNAAERHLVFGMIALRTGLVRRDQLIAAFRAWRTDKARSLGDHLIALGHLDEPLRAALERLADLHSETLGGGGGESLANISIDGATRERLSALDDSDLDATLARLGDATIDVEVARQSGGGPPTGLAGDQGGGGLRFQVLRLHARGGLGAVYVALDAELNREVALKRILDDHADDPASRARFLVEAEITGGLEHPGIVPFYGLGRYDDGRPYYAMRLVRGGSFRDAIDAFHKEAKTGPGRSLEFRRLLKTFTDVCNAVEYAHSRGVLHRDLKPANIIVGEHGETLVVDWGLAKPLGVSSAGSAERALSPASGGDSSATLPGRAMGTPAYMSPEQARGDVEALGPRSDVYSLGATLHHLLTGAAPFQGTLRTVLRAVDAGEFRPPRAIDPSIDPALEAIVLKAMATEPSARYPSAKAQADDVDRWLADERVEAYPEPWTRGLTRWLARHRAGVTGLAAAGLMALVGLGVLSIAQSEANGRLATTNKALDIQRDRAEAGEAEAIDALERFKDAIADNPELKNNPGLESLRKTLLKEPLAFFGRLRERLQAERDSRPESLFRLAGVARSHARLTHEIGDRRDAVQALRSASDMLEGLVRDHPAVAKYRVELASSRGELAYMLRDVGRNDEALAAYRRSLETDERLVRDHPDVDEYREHLGWSHNMHGLQLRVMGNIDEAGAEFEKAVAIFERLDRDHPDVVRYQAQLAKCLGSLADRLCIAWRFDEALAAFERAGEILERLARDHPEDTSFQADLAWGWAARISVLRRAARRDEALPASRRAVELYQRLARDNPSVTQYQANLRSCLNDWGLELREAGRLDEAREAIGRAVEIGERLVRDHPDDPSNAISLSAILNAQGLELREAGRLDEAREAIGRAVEIGERLVRDHPDDPSHGSRLGGFMGNLSVLDMDASRFADARERLLKAAALHKKALAANPAHPEFRQAFESHLNGLLQAERGLNHHDEAARVARELAEFRLGTPRDEAVDARLRAVADGGAAKDDDERLLLADRAYLVGRFRVAVRLWGEVLDSSPKIVENRQAQYLFGAACCACLAAEGIGAEPPGDDAEKARLRGLALGWLTAGKDACSKLLESGRSEDRVVVASALRRWRGASDLAGVRDPDSLAKLPDEERAAWITLWDEVAELIRKAG